MIEKYEMLNSFLSKYKDRLANEEIPGIFVELLISAEDHRFYSHNGVDLIAVIRAIYKTVFHGKIQGGSTISMQLVRVVTGSYERSLARKFQEIKLAIKLNRIIPKSDIPKLYLSTAYFGWQMNGVHAACRKQNLDIRRVTTIEAAEIIARLKYPEPRYKSHERLGQIKRRARHIVKRHEMLYAKRNNQLGRECIVDGRI